MRRARQTCEIALTSPVLSVLWGVIFIRRLFFVKNVINRCFTGASGYKVANLPINVESLIFCGIILILGLTIPGASSFGATNPRWNQTTAVNADMTETPSLEY